MKFKIKETDLKKTSLLVGTFLFIIALILTLKYAPITGLFVAEDMLSFNQPLNLEITSDDSYPIVLENVTESFELIAFKLSGKFIGKGKAKVFLEAEDGSRYLVLDSGRTSRDDAAWHGTGRNFPC